MELITFYRDIFSGPGTKQNLLEVFKHHVDVALGDMLVVALAVLWEQLDSMILESFSKLNKVLAALDLISCVWPQTPPLTPRARFFTIIKSFKKQL